MILTRFVFGDCAIPHSVIRRAAVMTAILMHGHVASAIEFSVGPPEIVYTKSQRSSGGGSTWPDGNVGVISNGNGTYDFYAANGSKSVLTTGTLDNPGGAKRSVSITNVPKKAFDYLAGGPVFEDPYSGARLMIYHAEVHQKSAKKFYSVLGMAISTDPEGREFRDLGLIVRPNAPSGLAEVGGGSFAIVNGYMNVYYKDWYTDGWTSEVAVARAPMAEIMTNALSGRSTAFTKYYNGGWTEPGIGGRSSHLETVNPANSWLAASYNNYINQLVMVSSQWSDDGGDLYYATSSDGVNWAPRQPLAVDPGEQFYPTLIGRGEDPSQTGESFYVYYTDSKKGAWKRWSDAQLRRRQITVDPQDAGARGTSTGGLGYTAEWVQIADYQEDFQGGGPASGWRYAWSANGEAGESSGYVPLLWSETEQVYNTTGGATMSPNPKTHDDDFLALTSTGGHPGTSKYMPIAGYTIQGDDGGGLYRLIDSSIQKSNSSLVTKEDGLGVLVYVNDTLIGPAASVSTIGVLTGFDRNLGSLNVGDTIWVLVDPLKSQIDDAYTSFDFTIQRLVYSAGDLMFAGSQLYSSSVVPECGAAALLLIGCGMHGPWRRCRRG